MLVEKMRPDAMVLRTVSWFPLSRPMIISWGTPVRAETSRRYLSRRKVRSSQGSRFCCWTTS